MLWIKIGWRNLWRNKRRTAIQLSVIAGSMFLAVFYNNFAKGIFEGMVAGGVPSGSGHIGIYHERYLGDRKVSDTFPARAIVEGLDQAPGVSAVLPRVHVPGLLRSSRDSRPAVAVGLDFAREAGQNTLLQAKYLVEGELPKAGNGILVGEKLALTLKVKVGKKVVWMAQNADGEIASRLFKVSGILRTRISAIDGGMVFGSREAMAQLIGRAGDAHEVAILLNEPDRAAAMLGKVQELSATAPKAQAYPWQRAMPDLATLIEVGNSKQKSMVFILFAVVAIGTLNTMLMSVTERTREFGMMRALGIGKGAIRSMILAEAFLLSLVGSAIGTALAVLVGLKTSTTGIDLTKAYQDMEMGGVAFDYVVRTGWDWPLTAALFVGMVVLCLLASLYPAGWALKVRPADAMRTY